ncbi:hypothetical protein [uncultured Rhodoblastus sp.]|uniref:hypothetical protein n=1 Tax=uncultured Rhodoblastus sp. TaxID=543037 RepID=UPI0025E22AE3|nr:hypothetical protein [uncultured Rhodoblastus sp.]
MAMRDRYRPITDNYKQLLLEELRNAAPVTARSAAGAGREDKRAAEAPSYCEIGIASAEKLSGGSLLFPSWRPEEEAGGWCIMIKRQSADIDSCDEYEIVARIKRDASGPEFLSLAYLCILDRQLDEKTIQSDCALVESRRISRRGVLKMFLESGDNGLRHRQFLVVPDPSPWLDEIERALY